jgi:hypothetical protein
MSVFLERGITYLAIDQEQKLTTLKSAPSNDLEILQENNIKSGSEFVKNAIKDFFEALKIASDFLK